MSSSDKKFNDMMAHSKMLENQISQLANVLKEHASPSSLPSQGLDPKRPINAIVTRSGRILENVEPKKSRQRRVQRKFWLKIRRDKAL